MDFEELNKLITQANRVPEPMTEQEAECLRRGVKDLASYKEDKQEDNWSRAVNNIAEKYGISLEDAAIMINNILSGFSSDESLGKVVPVKKKKTWKKNKFWE